MEVLISMILLDIQFSLCWEAKASYRKEMCGCLWGVNNKKTFTVGMSLSINVCQRFQVAPLTLYIGPNRRHCFNTKSSPIRSIVLPACPLLHSSLLVEIWQGLPSLSYTGGLCSLCTAARSIRKEVTFSFVRLTTCTNVLFVNWQKDSGGWQ